MAQLEGLLYEDEIQSYGWGLHIRGAARPDTATTSLEQTAHARVPCLRSPLVFCICNMAVYPEAIQKLTH